jgi:signal transduction histidine kinase
MTSDITHNNETSLIFENCPFGILSINHDGIVKLVNPAFCKITRVTQKEISDITSQELWKKLLEKYAIDGNLKTYIGGVFTLRSKDSIQAIRINCHLQTSGPIKQIFYIQDITAEAEVDRMKTEYLSTASHELRTPLAIILGFTELLKSKEFDRNTTLDIISTVHNQAKSLTQLINELLDLVRIESRKGKDFVMNEMSIADIIFEIKNEWGGIGKTDRIRINIPDNIPTVLIDREKIKQSIINLLSNAYKFSNPESEVKVDIVNSTKESERFLGIQVSDHGIGMTPEQLNHLFERFWRADDSSGNIPGTGLGLSIVKEIIEIHQGHIEVKSEFHKGTTITLWLPVQQQIMTV